jgi:hypothetical protein
MLKGEIEIMDDIVIVSPETRQADRERAVYIEAGMVAK